MDLALRPRQLLAAYRATGADLPFGDSRAAHPGVAMEGYFWRVTDLASGRVVVALIGVNQGPEGPWATLGLASHPGSGLHVLAHPGASAVPGRLAARAGSAFVADERQVRVDLAADARLDLWIDQPQPWPRRAFGGSSVFQLVPRLNQYWHPWLLGGRASGAASIGGQTWTFHDAQVYAEKNWGREGFPDAWWWGQAHGFEDADACVAFAGGEVAAGPIRSRVTALVVRLPGGRLIRLGNPGTSPVRARLTPESWQLAGRSVTQGWSVELQAEAPLDDAHVLPVPLPREHNNSAGAIEHLAGRLQLAVRRRGRLVWQGESRLAGLEHGGLAQAEAELRRRGVPVGAVGAPPVPRPVG